MSFLGKILGKRKDDFSDSAFDAGLPPMQEAQSETNAFGFSQQEANSQQGTNFSSSGVPSSNIASFMEQSGDDLTGLPPMDDDTSFGNQPQQQQQFPVSGQSMQPQPSRGQQLAHDYVSQQQVPQQHQATSEKSSAHSLEVIDVKLDAIRSELSVISQRLEKLERTKTGRY